MAANRSRRFADVFIHQLHRYVYCQNYYDQVRPDNDIFMYVRYLRLVMSDCIDILQREWKRTDTKRGGEEKKNLCTYAPLFWYIVKVSVYSLRVYLDDSTYFCVSTTVCICNGVCLRFFCLTVCVGHSKTVFSMSWLRVLLSSDWS